MLKIFVQVQTFRRGPFVPSHNFCHPARCQPYIQDILLCHWTDFTVYSVFLLSFVNIFGNILLVCIISIGMCDDISNMESASACFHICWLAYPSPTNLWSSSRMFLSLLLLFPSQSCFFSSDPISGQIHTCSFFASPILPSSASHFHNVLTFLLFLAHNSSVTS